MPALTAADAQRRGEAARLEQRRVDPVRELRRLVQRLLHVAPHLVEERLRRGGIGVRQLARELQVDRERDQVLLRAVVEVALDPAAVGIGGQDEPLPGRAQLLDLEAQPVERLPAALDVPNLQVIDLLLEDYRKLSVIEPAPSRGPAPLRGMAACRRTRLPPPWFRGGGPS